MDPDEFEGLEELYSDPNGPAYEQTETRSGPPLEYIASKLCESLRVLHRTHLQAKEMIDSTVAEPVHGAHPSASDVVRGIHGAFYQACVSYLALQNMLAHANPPSFADRLLAMNPDEFDEWMDDIARGGSVT